MNKSSGHRASRGITGVVTTFWIAFASAGLAALTIIVAGIIVTQVNASNGWGLGGPVLGISIEHDRSGGDIDSESNEKVRETEQGEEETPGIQQKRLEWTEEFLGIKGVPPEQVADRLLSNWQQVQAKKLGRPFQLNERFKGSVNLKDNRKSVSVAPEDSGGPTIAALADTFGLGPVRTASAQTASTTAGAGWVNFGPMFDCSVRPCNSLGYPTYGTQGRISEGGIAVHPTNDSIMYVSGSQGGLWKTTDAGHNWTPLTDNFPTQGAGAVALDPANPNVVYYATGDPLGYGGAGVGVFKSTDAGVTWALIGSASQVGTAVPGMAIDPIHTQNVFLASKSKGIVRSADGGVTWTNPLVGSAWNVVIDPQNPNFVYAAIASKGIYKSSDGGTTWAMLGGGLPTSGVSRLDISLSKNYPSNLVALYVISDTPKVYKTVDSGTTWANITGNINTQTFSGQGWYDLVVAISPLDPNKIFVGGIGASGTLDNGATWYSLGSHTVDNHAMAFTNGGRLLEGGDQGLYRATTDMNMLDSSSSYISMGWVNLTTNMINYIFYPGLGIVNSGNTLFKIAGGLQDNQALGWNILGDNSWSWVPTGNGDGAHTAISNVDSTYTYGAAVSFQHCYLKAAPSGKSLYQGCHPATDPVDAKTAYVVGTNAAGGSYYLFKTTDNGVTWVPLVPFSGDVTWLTIDPTDRNIIYAAQGAVKKSTNGGVSFVTVSPSMAINQLVVDPQNHNVLYAAVSNGVSKSMDGGITWVSIKGDLPSVSAKTVAINHLDSNQIYLGTTNGLYFTTNGGVNWQFDREFPIVSVVGLDLSPQNELYAETFGRGMFKTTLANSMPLTGAVSLVGPKGGECWKSGTTKTITWTASGVANVKLDYDNSNGTWTTIAASVPASSGSYTWSLPTSAVLSNARIRVSDVLQPNVSSISKPLVLWDGICFTSPSSNESWTVGTTHNITWKQDGYTSFTLKYYPHNSSTPVTLSTNVPASSGSYSFTVPSNDPGGSASFTLNSNTSFEGHQVSFTVYNPTSDVTIPSTTTTSPALNTAISGVVTFAGTASDNVGIAYINEFVDWVDKGRLATGTGTSVPWSYTFDTTTLTNTSHQFGVKVCDTSNNCIQQLTSWLVSNVAADTTAPTVTVTTPTAGTMVTGTIPVAGTASDNTSVSKVEVLVDGTVKGTASGVASWTYSLNTTTLTNGTHTIQARATDTSGNTGTSSSVSVTTSNVAPDTTAPTISITTPAAGSTISLTTSVSATASDSLGVTKVELYVDSTLKSTDTIAPYDFSLDTTTITNGTHTLMAKAYDAAGNVGSGSVSVSVANILPTTTTSLTTNKASYSISADKSMTMTATVTSNGAPLSGASVSFLITGANGTQVTTTATTGTNGVAISKYTFKRQSPVGTWSIQATASKSGYQSSTSSTASVTVAK